MGDISNANALLKDVSAVEVIDHGDMSWLQIMTKWFKMILFRFLTVASRVALSK